MLRGLCVASFFILHCSFFICEAQTPEFAHSTHDFGKVAHSTKEISHRFTFTNTGSEPLVITKTVTGCACVKADFSKRPVAPGESGFVEVVYEVSKKEAGVFYKVVDVYTNSAEQPRVSLIVKGNAVSDK